MGIKNQNSLKEIYNKEAKINDNLDIEEIEFSDKERLRDPIFKSIGYPSKIFYKNIQPFIRAYTEKDGVVIDSCAGSGSTGIASLLEDRKCILLDNSPHAVNMSYNIIFPVNLSKLNKVYNDMLSEIEEEINKIYYTRTSDGFAGYADVIIASNVYSCPSCENELILYNNETGKRSEYKCPNCSTVINISNKGIKSLLIDRRRPVEVTIKTTDKASTTKKETRKVTEDDIKLWSESCEYYESKYKDYWSPNEKIVYNRSYPRVGGWPGFSIDSTVSDLFPKPNLLALKLINHYIEERITDDSIKSFMKFIFTETLFRTSSRLFTSSGIKNVYHIPPLGKEQNVLTVFKRKYKTITKAKEFAQKILPNERVNERVKIIKGNARKLTIESNSVDYAFIDPPYGGMVPYAELNLFYSAWLKEKEDLDNEIIIPMDYEKKDEYVEKWGSYIEEAFGEIYRVVFCKYFLEKSANYFSQLLHLEFPNNCIDEFESSIADF